MIDYIVFLRGINVNGQNLIKMEDLRKIIGEIGLHEPKTYIQSGNIWVKSELSEAESVESIIRKAIRERLGFDVPTLALPQDTLRKIIDNNPFSHQEADKKRLYYTLLAEPPDRVRAEALMEMDTGGDKIVLGNKVVYLLVRDKYSKTKLTNQYIEKILKVKATTRNHATMVKMTEKI
ncbi:MAG TPA: DUF1697 domain-containing protein [Saprospiraceae bacterium]|nr:DUF1697 domain-containing protein [Saprospiraceae bacterium]HRN33343.1 DUF1697 domain-containing protein [Saprospiraceae bacterium]HRP85438.1 DUF1697 domain-containing protein [Saprospiraceae bacterium]